MAISFETYERVALEDDDAQWELVCGHLRRKPLMALEHNATMRRLSRQLERQLSDDFLVGVNSVPLRISSGTFYVPDLCVVPLELESRLGDVRSTGLEVYADPLPLVVEIWSPSTGTYDVTTKLLEYQQRGDAEIWRIHPYEKTLTAWRRQSDGSYSEATYHEGTIAPVGLPGIVIDIHALFR